MMTHPIDSVQWIDVARLDHNDWNPNHVLGPEFRLLEFSLLKQGWIQPILVSPVAGSDRYRIIDGFHRSSIARGSAKVRAMTDGRVPVCVLDIPESEAMLLTVRINRAKGTHAALKMHDLVTRLVVELGLDRKYVADSIGASADEVDLLLQEGVFKALNIEQHKYSSAWVPKA
jgi:ParB-like chromosome segregation protein Spo0J